MKKEITNAQLFSFALGKCNLYYSSVLSIVAFEKLHCLIIIIYARRDVPVEHVYYVYNIC